MDFFSWIMGYLVWETIEEIHKEEESEEINILNEPWVIETDIEIRQKTP
jgi:hypothetical protein